MIDEKKLQQLDRKMRPIRFMTRIGVSAHIMTILTFCVGINVITSNWIIAAINIAMGVSWLSVRAWLIWLIKDYEQFLAKYRSLEKP